MECLGMCWDCCLKYAHLEMRLVLWVTVAEVVEVKKTDDELMTVGNRMSQNVSMGQCGQE